jgi:phage gp36-like protein
MTSRFRETEMIQLTDRANLGIIDDVILDQAISDASAEIDGYLSKYQLPISPVPSVLVRHCCDIARYCLYDDVSTVKVDARYNAVIKYLEQVAKGTISLGVDDSGATPATNASAVIESGGRVFGRESKSFI